MQDPKLRNFSNSAISAWTEYLYNSRYLNVKSVSAFLREQTGTITTDAALAATGAVQQEHPPC